MKVLGLLCVIATLHVAKCGLVRSDVVYREVGEKCQKNGINSYEECRNDNTTYWIPNGDYSSDSKRFSVVSKTILGVKRVCRYNLLLKEEKCSSTPQCNATSYSYQIRTKANMDAEMNHNTTCLNEYKENVTECDKQCGTGKQIVATLCSRNISGDIKFSCGIEIIPCNTFSCYRWSEWESVCYDQCATPNKIYPMLSRKCLHHSGTNAPDTKCAVSGDTQSKKNGTCRFLTRQTISKCDTKDARTTFKFNDLPLDATNSKKANEKTSDQNIVTTEDSGSNLVWVWVVVAILIIAVFVLIVIIILKKRKLEFTKFKSVASKGIFSHSRSPQPTVTIQATEPPGKHDGYWTLKNTGATNTNSADNTLNASSSSIYENENTDSENIYATIESVRRKRRAPKPPLEEVVTERQLSEDDIVTEDGKIIRGGDVYSTINKKRRAALQASKEKSKSAADEDLVADLDTDYANIDGHKEQAVLMNNDENIDDVKNSINDCSAITNVGENVYSIPPDAV